MAKPELSNVESELHIAAISGLAFDCAGQTVRAEVLRWMVTNSIDSTITALLLRNATITGTLDLQELAIAAPLALVECRFESAPRLDNASLTSLRLSGSTMPGLHAMGIEVKGSVWLDEGFHSTQEVTLERARIGNELSLRKATLESIEPNRWALNANRIKIGGALFAGLMEADGQIRLISARIDGLVTLRGARLRNPGKICFQGERMVLGDSLFFQRAMGTKEPLEASGAIVLTNAQIAGGIAFEGALLTEPQTLSEKPLEDPTSIRATRLRVGRNLNLSDGLRCAGGIRVKSSEIGGTLNLHGIESCGGEVPINLSGTTADTLDLRFAKPLSGTLDLTNVTVVRLVDAAETWPVRISTDGFTYESLQPQPEVSAEQRLEWLQRNKSGYSPQPYEQLLSFYRLSGREQDAARVALAKQRARRSTLTWRGKAWGLLLDATVGYGYRTWLAGVWLLALTVVGTFVFRNSSPIPIADHPPAFRPFAYAFDLLVPLIDLGQESSFRMSGPREVVSWIFVLLGWLLTTSVAAGLSRLVNRH
ncbi:hypothetical protein F4553_006178 [Allocatelliglobosispora scoriae]|uniref:Membrane-associated oxidoreductase n=1 Tax=Allocatelliglobosispora scoriae TaxID=643052 RepID=A0A841BX62_9ACTN|nr:hypothetical protein [Allocatelliglobosispora scoriae]MBB5872744.1 hypothetical protein [Allocatelliglobosispora scoriae]